MSMIFAPEGTTSLHDKAPRYLSATRKPQLVGYMVLALLVGGFGVWAATAPIAGAVIVEGAVTAQNRNRVIQHFEGGIVREVSVVKGERVKADDTIYVIDDVRARAQLQRVQQQAVGLRAQLARLNAERLGTDALSFEQDVIDTAAALDVAHLLDEQRNEFQARRTRLASDDEILNQRVAALTESIDGFEAQLAAIDEQITIVREEANRKEDLLDRGLTNRSEYTELLRASANLVGQRGSIASQIAAARTQIIEVRERIVRQRTTVVEEAAVGINQVRLQLQDVNEQIGTARDVVDRTVVRSPVSGTVVELNVTTPGAVVAPGGTLATILPDQDTLVVAGRLSLNDIDLVTVGQEAQLQFVALNQRVTPNVPAEVTFISADSLRDERTGEPFYSIELQISELPDAIDPANIYPGMPVSSLVSTPDRTFFEYLAKPIMDSLRLAFREQ